MCQPDLTIEVADERLGGVKGFGTEHVCVKWRGLVDWVEEWEMYGLEEGEAEGLRGWERVEERLKGMEMEMGMEKGE